MGRALLCLLLDLLLYLFLSLTFGLVFWAYVPIILNPIKSKNLSVAIGFIGKTTNALSLKCMMEFEDIVKTFGSKVVNMIEAKPLEINYLL